MSPPAGSIPTRSEIRNVIKQQGKDKTVLFSSHILQEVEAICDRVIIINKGYIVADDTLVNLQAGKNEMHIVFVQFQEPVSRKLIEQITGVIDIQQPQTTNYKLQTVFPDQVRKQLLQLS